MFAQYQNLNTGSQKSVRRFIHSPGKVIATRAVVFGANGAKSRKYKKIYKKTCCRPSSTKSFFFKSVMRFFLQFYIQSVAAAIVLEWINTSSVILLVILFLKYPFITSSFFLKNVCIRIYRSDPVKNKINFSNNLRKTHCYLCTKSRHKQLHKKLVIMLKTITF